MKKENRQRTGYERLTLRVMNCEDEEEDRRHLLSRTRSADIETGEQEEDELVSALSESYQTRGWKRMNRRKSSVDVKAINVRLEQWADDIAARLRASFMHTSKSEFSRDSGPIEIYISVFQCTDWIERSKRFTEANMGLDGMSRQRQNERVTNYQFRCTVDSVREAISRGIHPSLISQGSSGSYFARDIEGQIVGVFKPKDEEPYASRNPKWTKWIHRNLFPFFFGRACLIPNLGYISEAASYVLDERLGTNLVPFTQVVSLASKSFHYDYWDRRAFFRKKKPLAEKIGSFQWFLRGYQDASTFFKEHPWPEDETRWSLTTASATSTTATSNSTVKGDVGGTCGLSGDSSGDGFWTEDLKVRFREELEKLVILDYIMRNTDRGSDNWMIKVIEEGEDETVEGPKVRKKSVKSIKIGAIDNSLSWPWKHPDAWRSYPFGWLFLPVSLIGKPFSEKTRRTFLPLLTSKEWWSETQYQLRRVFTLDEDFQEGMFAKQIAVAKGQAWNVVETLKRRDHGPLELAARQRVHVWDDIIEMPQLELMEEWRMECSSSRPYNITGKSDDKKTVDSLSGEGCSNNQNKPAQRASLKKERQVDEMDISWAKKRDSLISTNDNRLSKYSATSDDESDPENGRTAMNGRAVRKKVDIWTKLNQSGKDDRNSQDFSRDADGGASGSMPGSRKSLHSDNMREEIDGDLSCGTRRRVIVERLCQVESSTPFFSCC